MSRKHHDIFRKLAWVRWLRRRALSLRSASRSGAGSEAIRASSPWAMGWLLRSFRMSRFERKNEGYELGEAGFDR
jgi:hypothetical protein